MDGMSFLRTPTAQAHWKPRTVYCAIRLPLVQH